MNTEFTKSFGAHTTRNSTGIRQEYQCAVTGKIVFRQQTIDMTIKNIKNFLKHIYMNLLYVKRNQEIYWDITSVNN